uniref:Uncharacterized protein n=1 Tax=Zea mays TaxID=4577 RepID=A0A804PWY9_MAIZE
MLLLPPARGTQANHAHRTLAACAWPARAVWDTESFPSSSVVCVCSPPAAAAARSCLLVLGRWQSYVWSELRRRRTPGSACMRMESVKLDI